MNNLRHTAAVAALAVGFALPFAAQSLATETMDVSSTTCADLMAMSQEEQSATMDAMHMAQSDMASDDMAADDMASDDMASDDMASDDMASDDMAADDMAADDMASDDMASDDMASDDKMSEETKAMMSACEGNPDMMAMDAMKSSMDQ
ncbi:hypothetical protein [Roseovarius sp. Pro17]|uniref:hypothetical protein n=1 Tax=Roseovarius sp. Pro17 TaxID=3108175 RepID=UPI002D791835|nr:hypothetical protein [Roseovarius sp. Pro17]